MQAGTEAKGEWSECSHSSILTASLDRTHDPRKAAPEGAV